MKKQITETSSFRKSYSKPQFNVVKIAGLADLICTSNEGYEEEDTDDWFNTNP
ncbi:MAG: hypothetical protein MJZ89_04305 [Paludibacteraceae bacterium]|nr:hypothetical protein [Paludibacteraceae bacterium]